MSQSEAKGARISRAVLASLEAARKAADAGNAGAMRHAVLAALGFLKRCDDRNVIALALDRLIQLARRSPASKERDALLAKVEAITGKVGHA